MSQNSETHEEKEARIEANRQEKKAEEDKSASGAGRHRGGHESSQRPGKTKDKDDEPTST